MVYTDRYKSVLHEIPDGNGQILSDDGGHLWRRHQELGLTVGLGHDRGAVGVGQALDLAARLDHVVHRHLKSGSQVPASKIKVTKCL